LSNNPPTTEPERENNVKEHLEQWVKREMGCVTGNAVLAELREQDAIIQWLSRFVQVDDVGDYPNGDEPQALGFVVSGEALEESLGIVRSRETTLAERIREILASEVCPICKGTGERAIYEGDGTPCEENLRLVCCSCVEGQRQAKEQSDTIEDYLG